MDLIFDQGSQAQPRGHAILYYRSGNEILATYMVILPLKVDFAKYIPPVLASQVKAQGLEDFSAFAIPPVPEATDGSQFLEELARLRGDDLVFGGDLPSNDFLEAAQRVNDAVQSYTKLCQQWAESQHAPGAPAPEQSGFSVDEVLFSLMGEKDKLGDLTKLVGKLQFAVDVKDARLLEEAEKEIRILAGYLPEEYHVHRIIESAEKSTGNGPRLAQLYLERCYKLADQDSNGLQAVDQAIRDLE
ncbi:MAG: hypothetical protein EXR53_06195 [Dehalococcoidia bacterium]|nr:hypothetical protein [Dehalococcoidia bacterium]